MKDATQPAGVIAQNIEGISPCVALVDDHVQSEIGGDSELLPEEARLGDLVGGDNTLTFGQAVVVQAGFTDGGNTRMAGESAQHVIQIIRRLIGGRRVNARHGVDHRVTLG